MPVDGYETFICTIVLTIHGKCRLATTIGGCEIRADRTKRSSDWENMAEAIPCVKFCLSYIIFLELSILFLFYKEVEWHNDSRKILYRKKPQLKCLPEHKEKFQIHWMSLFVRCHGVRL
jgi:hypothetical protein